MIKAPLTRLFLSWLLVLSLAGGAIASPDESQVVTQNSMIGDKVKNGVEAGASSNLQIFGKQTLRRGNDGVGAYWLVAVQESNQEYCSFYETQSSGTPRNIYSYIDCKINSAVFADYNKDGLTDALYRITIRSNIYNARVNDEILILSNPNGSGFCKSAQNTIFKTDATHYACQ
ncbi:hypothetical protein AACH06_29555 [Ideonella sp. DXS29W]|uniref:Uncharacterized protein n=1 Tax=Ideonella lacteola TaxID=2984193 RepID=A0ABU9C1P7_9BURK